MPNFGYSITGIDPDRTAKASGRDLRISPKAAREVCNAISNMTLGKAKSYLEEVIAKKVMVPFRRHKKKQAHHGGLHKWYAGRYPIKAAGKILKILRNAENIAEYKGLDVDNLRIIHAVTQRGRKVKKYISRAFGRSSPYFEQWVHVEIVLSEAEEALELEEEL
ncbi:MAG: 50S ribosomal protein L22 [Promethearchaeota archaeon]